MADRSFAPVDVSDDILDRFRKLPVATTWAAVANVAGVPLPFMEGVRNFTPGKRLAARARTLRFLPPRPDLDAEAKRGEDSPNTERWRDADPAMSSLPISWASSGLPSPEMSNSSN